MMTNYGFTLVVDGIPNSDEGFIAFAGAVYGVAPDSTVSMGRVGFDRDAPSLRDAIVSAIESVHRADPAVTVVGVVLDDGQPINALLGLAATYGDTQLLLAKQVEALAKEVKTIAKELTQLKRKRRTA